MVKFITALGAGIIASLGGETVYTKQVSAEETFREMSKAFATNKESVICEDTNNGRKYSVVTAKDEFGVSHEYTWYCFD